MLLAGRNAHKAFVNAAALLDVPVRWLCPAAGEAYYSGAVTPEQLEWELARSREPVTAVYLTCPDYLGELPDVAALATVCRRAGVLLAVDNAHGAYLKFLSPSRHPMDLGADLCCDSAHKTLPVVTGGAYLHIAHQAPELLHRQAKASMGLWGSSSPSYLILQSLDAANELLADYPEKLQALLPQLESLRRRLAARGWEVRPGRAAEGDAVSQRVRLHRLGGGGGAGERRHLPGVLRHGSCGADGIASERPGGAAAAGGGAGGAAPAAGHPAGAAPHAPAGTGGDAP